MATFNLLSSNIGNPTANETLFLALTIVGVATEEGYEGASESFVIHALLSADGSKWSVIEQKVISELKDPRLKHDYAYLADSDGSNGQAYAVSQNGFAMNYTTTWSTQGAT
jgi:hypothetical protein